MPEPSPQSAIERFILAVFVGTAVAAFATSNETPAAWLLEVPCAISIFWQLRRVPPLLARLVRYASWAVLGGAVARGLIFMAFPALLQTRLTLVPGYGLALFSALFLLGTPVWSPASTLFPATIGTLMVACFIPNAPLYGALSLSGAAVFAYLALGSQMSARAPKAGARGPKPGARVLGQIPRLAVAALGIFLIAWSIIRFLPLAQVKVEQTTYGLFSPQTANYSGLSLESRLGDLEQLKLSTRVVMRVWTSRPQKLRGRVYTHFDGQAWQVRRSAAARLSPETPELPSSEDMAGWLKAIPGGLFIMPGRNLRQAAAPGAIRTKIVQSVFNPGMLVSPPQKVLLRLPVPEVRTDAFENLSPAISSPVEIYGVINVRTGDVVQPAGSGGQAEALNEFLALPEDTDARLKTLAARLAAGTSGADERIRRTVAFVQDECHYSLETGKFHSRQPVAEFLFEKKRGYCQFFASAAAVLLRLQGVPSRYVSGFNVQDGNRKGGHYVVREADAHAWIEAYVPGKGWIEADPTPEAEYEALHAGLKGGWVAAAEEWVAAEINEMLIQFRQGDWTALGHWLWPKFKALLRLLLLAAIATIVLRLLRRLRGRFAGPRRRRDDAALPFGASGSPEMVALLSRLDRAWSGLGFVRHASRAPLEHLAAIPAEKMSPAFRAASERAVECFYRASFGGLPVARSEIREIERALEQAGA